MFRKMLLVSLFAVGSGLGVFAQTQTPAPGTAPTAAQPSAKVVPDKPQRNFWAQFGRDIVLYIPNRILDTTNIMTIKLGGGGTVAAEVKLTEFGRLGGSHGPRYIIESGYHGQYGVAYQDGTEFGLWPWAYTNYEVSESAGTIKGFALVQDFGLTNPSLYPYEQNTVDLWSVGAEAGLLVSVKFEFHARAVPNFIAGFFFLNINGDDLK